MQKVMRIIKNRDQNFSAREPLVVLLDENKSRFLSDLFAEPEFEGKFRVLYLDLQQARRSYWYRYLRLKERLRRRNLSDLERSTEAKFVLHMCFKAKAHQVLSVDNKLELLEKIVEFSEPRRMRCSVVQMGSNPVHRSRDAYLGSRKVPVTMFSWGARERDEYSRAGKIPERVVPIGSLKFELARRNSALKGLGNAKIWDICLVSMFASTRISHRDPSESVLYEQMTMPAMISILRPIIVRHRLKVIVALKAGQRVIVNASEDEEKEFYKAEFGDLVDMTNPATPYASYAAASSSKLIIARNSGLLSEFMASDSRVLFVNPTPFERFDAPPEIPYRLRQPSESELENEIFRLLGMSAEMYRASVRPIASRFCVNSDGAIQSLSRELAEMNSRLP